MQVLRLQDRLEIVMFQAEVYLLQQSLENILKNYRAKKEELPEPIQKMWFDKTAGMDEEDHELWLEHLIEFRGENSKLAERMLSSLRQRQMDKWPVVLKLPCDEADALLTIINDQRLFLAAQYGVGEQEMVEDCDYVIDSPEKHAVLTIHFLALLMELVIMRLDSPEDESGIPPA